ncbi:hypothetical protein GGI12_002169 [Dipsacomyces acuminosporus]|nr:hypothetical protein GGI12_002169 [Dipsacomyces acuminosporus]
MSIQRGKSLDAMAAVTNKDKLVQSEEQSNHGKQPIDRSAGLINIASTFSVKVEAGKNAWDPCNENSDSRKALGDVNSNIDNLLKQDINKSLNINTQLEVVNGNLSTQADNDLGDELLDTLNRSIKLKLGKKRSEGVDETLGDATEVKVKVSANEGIKVDAGSNTGYVNIDVGVGTDLGTNVGAASQGSGGGEGGEEESEVGRGDTHCS